MTSPLVTRLLTLIDSCTDAEQRAVRMAELACYWARTGEFEESDRIRSELRQGFGDGHSAQVSILIMCIESLLLYYKDLSIKAHDRMMRANLLSKSFNLPRLDALTSAWLAHIDFNQNRFDAMCKGLDACAQHIEADDGNAECRASLVLGDAFLFAGDKAASRVWYEIARRSANALGDHAAIGAMTYNRAALRVSNARFTSLREGLPGSELSLINTEVSSAINYQAVAQLKSLDHLLDAAKIGVLMLQGADVDAKVAIQKLLFVRSPDDTSNQARLLRSDLTLLKVRAGDHAGVSEWLNDVHSFANALSADDRAQVLTTAATAAKAIGDKQATNSFRSLADMAIEEHAEIMGKLRTQLAPFGQGLFPHNELQVRK